MDLSFICHNLIFLFFYLQQKFFDSGDYQMAKQKVPTKILAANPPSSIGLTTGDEIPTPETVPTRKTSIIQSKLASPAT